jgi:hypothetical protein
MKKILSALEETLRSSGEALLHGSKAVAQGKGKELLEQTITTVREGIPDSVTNVVGAIGDGAIYAAKGVGKFGTDAVETLTSEKAKEIYQVIGDSAKSLAEIALEEVKYQARSEVVMTVVQLGQDAIEYVQENAEEILDRGGELVEKIVNNG